MSASPAPTDKPETVIQEQENESKKRELPSEGFSESFKLILGNVGKYARKSDVLKLLKNSGFDDSIIRNLKKYPKSEFAIVSFSDELSKIKGREKLEALNNVKNGEPFVVKEYVPQVLTKKDFNGRDRKKQKKGNQSGGGDQEVKPSCIEDQVAPFRCYDYEEQLTRKQRNIVKALKKVKKESLKFETNAGRKVEDLAFWLQKDYMRRPKAEDGTDLKPQDRSEYNTGEIIGCCCPIEKIKPSPVRQGYRNKCEFTLGLDKEKKICTGFRMGRFRDLDVSVEKPSKDCMIVSNSMIEFADAFTKFLESSPLNVYDTVTRTGVWRQVAVRTTTKEKDNEMLILIQLKQSDIEEKSVLESEQERLRKEFLERSFDNVKIVSINISYYDGASVQENVIPDVVYGSNVIVEELDGLRYNVSPGAFFQVNTKGAEVLYNQVRECAMSGIPDEISKQAVLLDVCCGTGTIGLSLAKKFKHVIGIDLSNSAIQDARKNATLNNCTNATFVSAAAEHVLGSIVVKHGQRYEKSSKIEAFQKHLDKMSDEDKQELEKAKDILKESRSNDDPLIAIVDPPRGGLHQSVIRALRMAPKLEKIIYVSCNPTGSFINDARLLCATTNSKRRPGVPYAPIKSIPVDMFPHTDHCELVTIFKRTLPEETPSKE